jgi:hypothetical protein
MDGFSYKIIFFQFREVREMKFLFLENITGEQEDRILKIKSNSF